MAPYPDEVNILVINEIANEGSRTSSYLVHPHPFCELCGPRNTSGKKANAQLIRRLSPGSIFPVPLKLIDLEINVRPVPPSNSRSVFSFSNKTVFSTSLLKLGMYEGGVRQCHALNTNKELPFRLVPAGAIPACSGCCFIHNCTLQVAPKTTVAIPLLYAWARILVRPISPVGGGWLYCKEPLHWMTLLQLRQTASDLRECPVINTQVPPFRFCVHVKRDNFPVDSSYPSPPSSSPLSAARQGDWVQPGHSIILVSPLTLQNLLPYDLHFKVKTTENQGRVKPGEDSSLHSIDPTESITLVLWTDSFMSSGEINLNPTSSPYVLAVKLEDFNKRILYIHVRVRPHYGGALKVIVYAGYWLINKTGLPLIFKQEGVSHDAAGQDKEHEVARCAAPLLFSFTDRDASPMLVARVGSNLHPEARAQFCHKLPLTQGTWMRRLRVSRLDSRPDHVYVVGVDVRPGRGRYRDTYMVTFSPRFQIENRSSHELTIAQKCFATSFKDPSAQSTWLRAIPGCWLPFHWPRLDKDQLLCICLRDLPGSYWSGGFLIDKIDSFYLNIRDISGNCSFIRVEIIINDATYFIVFTDADSVPPPFRIDNFSEVPITYFQTGTQEERLRTVVKPRSCVAYAWDDVMLLPHITCIAPGGTSATYNMDVLDEGARLTYENFIYIAFTGTFSKLADLCSDIMYDIRYVYLF
ncbi:Vacuolar protein sorting-associated protein [Halocaridina rubra]|uniref:Vacuolar protein sorting-associated protein n=1 Tax=Halocaridina rubra TaxID=373956 RepID=A0AAN9A9C3_HALRR